MSLHNRHVLNIELKSLSRYPFQEGNSRRSRSELGHFLTKNEHHKAGQRTVRHPDEPTVIPYPTILRLTVILM